MIFPLCLCPFCKHDRAAKRRRRRAYLAGALVIAALALLVKAIA